MKKYIDIDDENFWDVLFDEACVEGLQADRINEQISVLAITETEIINNVTKYPVEAYADSTLYRMTKADLIEIIKCYRYNQSVAHDALDTQYINFQRLLKEERAKAINEFAMCLYSMEFNNKYGKLIALTSEEVEEIAEQLKEVK